jgi:hypothetical protein
MKIVKDPQLSKLLKGGSMFIATHKSVEMSLARTRNWVPIYSIESKNQNKGEAQEAITLLKEEYPDKEVWGSIPINPIIKHIFDKLQIKYGPP